MSIPSRLSENTFRCYEGHIKRAVERFPEETEFPRAVHLDLTGKPLSGNTFAARFRDSLVSLLRFGWETNVDTAKLRAIAGQYAVAFNSDGSVWFRHKGIRGRPSQLVQESRAITEAARVMPEPWKHVDQAELSALALLMSRGRLQGPYIISGEVDVTLAALLENDFGVSIIYDANEKQTVIT